MSDDWDIETAFEEARIRAREAVSDVYPDAIEVDAITGEMKLHDGVCALGNDGREVGVVIIMLDEENRSYALIDQRVHSASSGADVIHLIESAESIINILFASCGDVTSAGAAWAAISSTASRAARARIEELGGDVDEVRGSLDRFFLIHPDA